MKADAAHDGIDMVSGLVALVALSFALLRPESFGAAEQYGAFAVGLIVMFTAVRVVREASMHLMDTMPDDMAMLDVRVGDSVLQGGPIGRAGTDRATITVELRKGSQPVDITPLIT